MYIVGYTLRAFRVLRVVLFGPLSARYVVMLVNTCTVLNIPESPSASFVTDNAAYHAKQCIRSCIFVQLELKNQR